MNNFELSRNAIMRIIEGLALEYGKAQDQKIRSLCYEADWSDSLDLGADGLALEKDFISNIVAVVEEFFDLENGALLQEGHIPTRPCVWVDSIAARMLQTCTRFHFRPAGHLSNEALCTHRVDHLMQEAAAAASLLQGRRRVVSLISPHSLLGLVVSVMAPALLEVEVIDARKHSLDQLSTELAFGDVLVATPSLWAYLIREGLVMPDNSMGVCFGEMMTLELAASMRRNGVGVLRELYGSTQTGLVAWRDSPSDDFVLFEQWSRDPDNEDCLLRRGPDHVYQTFETMDYVDWKNERTFALRGRRDGAVQIGAVNVFPEKISKTLQELDWVDICKVRIASNGKGTNRLIADITLVEKQSADETTAKAIDNWCRQRLAVHERPHILNFFEKP